MLMPNARPEGLESPTVVGAQVANELLNITGVEASFVFTVVKGVIYVSARSYDSMNVTVGYGASWGRAVTVRWPEHS